jgi:hypothetical protein
VPQRHLAIVLALVAATLVALFLCLRATAEVPRSPAMFASRAESVDEDSQAARSAIEDDRSSRAEAESSIDAATQSSTRNASGIRLAATDAKLLVRCIDKTTRRPLEGIRVLVSDADSIEDDSAAEMHATDSRGEVEIDLPARIELYVIAMRGDELGERAVDREVSALAIGERREFVLEIPMGDGG